jgi:hypothetical protein
MVQVCFFVGAIGVVAMRNPFSGVLALIVHLFSLAVLFLLLSSAFVAAAQGAERRSEEEDLFHGATRPRFSAACARLARRAASPW